MKLKHFVLCGLWLLSWLCLAKGVFTLPAGTPEPIKWFPDNER